MPVDVRSRRKHGGRENLAILLASVCHNARDSYVEIATKTGPEESEMSKVSACGDYRPGFNFYEDVDGMRSKCSLIKVETG